MTDSCKICSSQLLPCSHSEKQQENCHNQFSLDSVISKNKANVVLWGYPWKYNWLLEIGTLRATSLHTSFRIRKVFWNFKRHFGNPLFLWIFNELLEPDFLKNMLGTDTRTTYHQLSTTGASSKNNHAVEAGSQRSSNSDWRRVMCLKWETNS